jgi:ArsR family transcriptional regulator, arsenate/arsenite/antimonite-responsive transcriptional repressor
MCVNMSLDMTTAPAGTRVAVPILDCTPLLSGAPLDDQTATRLAALLRVLADPGRLRILSLIQSQQTREACVCHLTDALGLSQPTVSHHLRVLYEAHLVDRERRGNWVYYRTVPHALDDLREALGDIDTRERVAPALAGRSDNCSCV